ncbi:GNAT family N-acetyltransferase [Parasulfitobacter algicola]|uniref:GNAT family N-acetyltransferase n=1 Tax=Parasulfitobacter algicola TaxID=2614809 RepID=A0ABX2IPG7_9RHOB|nr:GNAT family N-acetyltransferase [Sulfitobacter algicola]NSX54450.1 GNAT family N-acetyltransferase [Sulfitobacter algicola]
MTPDQLADLHALGFDTPRPWTAQEFQSLLNLPGTILFGDQKSIVLARIIADEAEILTLVTHPHHRRGGLAADLLSQLHTHSQMHGCTRVYLEVAAPNTAARTLYARHGYSESGRRPNYYRTPDGARIDALILTKTLT